MNSFITRLGPIHISDGVISLSAILLDDEYYEILKNGVTVVDNVSVLDLEHIILFKIKAWIDVSVQKANGETIDRKMSRSIRIISSAYVQMLRRIEIYL